jgi:signal transduction histidine kinase
MLELEREQLRQDTVRAREQERMQVAHELHDQIIQALVGLHYQLSEMRTCWGLNRDLDLQLAQLQRYNCRTIEDLRRICADLRPPALDRMGLAAAVRAYVCKIERQSSFRIALHIAEETDSWLPEDVALCIFRILQETLSNVQKHAAARQVEVCFLLRQNEVCLTVRDDGKGFHVPPYLDGLLDDQHFGLIGLRERINMVGGELTLTSEPGQGTLVVVCIPSPFIDAALRGKE